MPCQSGQTPLCPCRLVSNAQTTQSARLLHQVSLSCTVHCCGRRVLYVLVGWMPTMVVTLAWHAQQWTRTPTYGCNRLETCNVHMTYGHYAWMHSLPKLCICRSFLRFPLHRHRRQSIWHLHQLWMLLPEWCANPHIYSVICESEYVRMHCAFPLFDAAQNHQAADAQPRQLAMPAQHGMLSPFLT